ncbi:MAG: hypothetical protein ACSW8I_07955 [bacterium]
MKKIYTFLIVSIIATSLVSCDKESTDEGKHISMISIQSYSQDYTDGQLVNTHGSYGETTLQWRGDLLYGIQEMEIIFVYEGNRLKEINMAITPQLNHFEFIYNGDKLKEIYGTGSSGWTKSTLSYNTNGEIDTIKSLNSNGNEETSILTWRDGNVIRLQYQGYSYYDSPEPSLGTIVYEFVYDNKTSAFSGMEQFYLFASCIGDPVSSISRLSRNNLLRRTRVSNESNNDGISYIYSYDGDYPTSMKTTEGYSNSYSSYSRTTTTFFQYTDGSGATLPEIITIDQIDVCNGDTLYSRNEKYTKGSPVALNPYYHNGYHFVRWSDGNVDNPRRITANLDATYTAIFQVD